MDESHLVFFFSFAGGNRNAGASYTKVSNALKDLEFEVTADNAMSLSKGKTKIPGVGKSSAEKMKEFMETGTMQKLEEKRADNA
jgi:DNA polymerase/3'-5' exonuclease PolX